MARSRSASLWLPVSITRFQKGAGFRVGSSIGQDDGQGHLGFAEIVAHRLAHQGLAAGIVERIVDQLEGDAEIFAIGAQAGDEVDAPCSHNVAPDFGSRREQCRRLGATTFR